MRRVGCVCAFIAARAKGGEYADLLKDAIADLRDAQSTHAEKKAARSNILRYLFGERITYRLYKDRAVCLTGVCLDADKLYHFTPVTKIPVIRKRGIRPRQWYVYLTDDPDSFREDFIHWKAYMSGRSETYEILCVDAKRLRRIQPIYRTTRPHEVVTRAIAPKYILFEKRK